MFVFASQNKNVKSDGAQRTVVQKNAQSFCFTSCTSSLHRLVDDTKKKSPCRLKQIELDYLPTMFSFLSRNGTVQSLIAFSLLLLTDVQEVDASCTSSSEPCEPLSGNCFDPVLFALNGDLPAAIDALEYGKYCGRLNRCRPKKIASDLCPEFDEVDRKSVV